MPAPEVECECGEVSELWINFCKEQILCLEVEEDIKFNLNLLMSGGDASCRGCLAR